jgi:hypothetical protein
VIAGHQAVLHNFSGLGSQRIRFNDLPLHVAPRCDAVNVDISRHFRANVTQFLHSFRFTYSRTPQSSSLCF